jgi:sugar lactone lactonase YvrE
VLPGGLSSSQFEVSTSLIAGGASGSTTATAKAAPIQTVYYTFNKQTTPAKFAYAQATGNSFVTLATNPTPDTSVIPAVPPCTAGTTYPAFSPTETTNNEFSWCQVFVQLNAQMTGSLENELQMLDSSNNVISGSNVDLTGIGQGSAVSAIGSPVVQAIASGLNQPKQVAADPWGNSYVADSALKAIEKYPAGTTSPTSGTVFGTGLSAPTGVAVDGAGNLYIGDSGNVYEVPYVNGALATSKQAEIATGLGTGNLNLAADASGDVFVADEAKKQVVVISNPQAALLQQGLPLQTLGATAGFTGPSAIATDNSGNVWVADGSNLWEITMPFGGVTEITSKLQAPVTGLAVDPSGSVFVADASGVVWIPYQTTSTSSGLNINGAIQVTGLLGTNNSAAPFGVALDGSQNAYVTYGSGSAAGLAQLGISGTLNFNNFGEVEPNVPLEADAQLFNLGNTPLTLAALSGDTVAGTSAADYTVGAATLNSPACGPSTNTQPGTSCYLGLNILAPAAGQTSASVTVLSNAVNAPAGVNIALSASVVPDLRPATSLSIGITPSSGAVYPGTVQIKVTVSSSAGTPTGSVILSVPGSGTSQSSQTQALNSSGVATFNFTNLLGGTYSVNALYGGGGTAGATQNTCSPAGSACFAGSAGKTTFTVNPATPKFTVGPPGTEGCLTWTATNCTPNPNYVTSYLGNTYVYVASNTWITASVTSSVGTPTGSVSFLVNGKPADSTQAQSSLNSSGIANFSTVNLPLGVYTITAVYNGDQNFASQSIALSTFEVIVPSIQITSTPSTLSVTPGTPAQATLTLMPLVGFSKNVSLECITSTLPQYSECTFAYPNSGQGVVAVGTTGAAASSIVVTISTNVPVNGGMASIARQAPWALAGLFGFGLLGLIAGRRRFNRYLTLICAALMLCGVFMGIAACTNSGYSTPPAAPKVSSPAGTYNVQIITYDPTTQQQNSLTTPLFTLPTTVQ